jgi:hypothetical protein
MNRFVLKVFLFLLPFLFLSIITSQNYDAAADGDLSRIGYLQADQQSRGQFSDEFSRDIIYKNLSELDLSREHVFDLLVIGDSFSRQGSYSFSNYAAEDFEVINYDAVGTGNPIQVLRSLINGDFFSRIKPRYILLESVERTTVQRAIQIDNNAVLNLSEHTQVYFSSFASSSGKIETSFPPSEIVKFPLYNFLYLFDDNAFISPVYRFESSVPLFSSDQPARTLVFEDDLKNLALNNFKGGSRVLNSVLNTMAQDLAALGIELIFLPAPDKYSVYYPYLIDQAVLKEPLFHDMFRLMEKSYLYIDAMEIFQTMLPAQKDLYFYDDTHWSPIASRKIAEEIWIIISAAKKNH